MKLSVSRTKNGKREELTFDVKETDSLSQKTQKAIWAMYTECWIPESTLEKIMVADDDKVERLGRSLGLDD